MSWSTRHKQFVDFYYTCSTSFLFQVSELFEGPYGTQCSQVFHNLTDNDPRQYIIHWKKKKPKKPIKKPARIHDMVCLLTWPVDTCNGIVHHEIWISPLNIFFDTSFRSKQYISKDMIELCLHYRWTHYDKLMKILEFIKVSPLSHLALGCRRNVGVGIW